MLKCDEKFLWNLLSLSQEGNFKAGRFALIYADEKHITSSCQIQALPVLRINFDMTGS